MAKEMERPPMRTGNDHADLAALYDYLMRVCREHDRQIRELETKLKEAERNGRSK